MRWSLPYAEICYCQGVLAPAVFVRACPEKDVYRDGELWFADDHLIYELTMRRNWKKNKMDELLDRIEFCGKSIMNGKELSFHILTSACLSVVPLCPCYHYHCISCIIIT